MYFGTFDNTVYRNTDEPQRAATRRCCCRAATACAATCTVHGHWTMQLENEGNFEGEAANQPGMPSLFGDYPEVFTEDRNYPIGRFDDFQRHKVRLWAIYNRPLGRFGAVDLSGMYGVQLGA